MMTAHGSRLLPLFACLLTLLCLLPGGARADDVFTVSGIRVDVTAGSAAAAREKAFQAAQVKGFKTLAQRLMTEEEFSRLKVPDTATLSGFIKDFEVTDEQLSAVRYLGTYTFRFRDGAVRTYLTGQGLAFADVSSKPVLALPFYRQDGKTVLWGDANPWRAAWQRSHGNQGLVPVVVPLGDLADIQDIGDDQSATYDPARLRDMTARYNAGDAFIMIAEPVAATADKPYGGLTVSLYRTDSSGAAPARTVKVDGTADLQGQKLLDRAVRDVRAAIQKDWKTQTAGSAMPSLGTVRIRVRFQSMREWIETQQALRHVDGVDKVNVVSLRAGEALADLSFRGDEERLRLAFAQADIAISGPQNGWSAGVSVPWGEPAAVRPVYDVSLNRYSYR